jgi:hypothetical protein
MNFRKSPLLALFFLTFLLPSCSPAATQPQPTPAPSATRLPPTLTPQPSDTAIPTPTATETAAPTALPTYAPLSLPKGPILIYTGSASAMRVFWQWTETAVFTVEWGADETYALGSADVAEYDAENHLYAYDFSGLQPGARYAYRILFAGSAVSGAFRTAPGPEATGLKFVCYGDTRTNPDLHDAVAAQVIQLYQTDPQYQTFNLFVGDFVNYGDEEQYWQDELFAPAWSHIHALLANMAFLPVIGNHEGGGLLFRRYFALPVVKARYGSFDYGPAHIVLLDQYVPFGPGSNQYAWLEKDLAASSKQWKFVVLHEPAWSAAGGHDNNAEAQALQPLFEQAGVSIVFAGHNHYYARAVVGGIQHLTIGTGGAPLYTPFADMPHIVATYQGTGYAKFEIDGNTLSAWFVAADGTVMDTFTITK